jgi:hypothetical protein
LGNRLIERVVCNEMCKAVCGEPLGQTTARAPQSLVSTQSRLIMARLISLAASFDLSAFAVRVASSRGTNESTGRFKIVAGVSFC